MNLQFKAFQESLGLLNRYSNRGAALFAKYALENYGTKELRVLMANEKIDWQKFLKTMTNELEPPMPELKPRNNVLQLLIPGLKGRLAVE